MNLQQLLYFRTAARMEHMTAAASALHISQPSLTITIRRLEEELGAELFEHQGRNIRLSDFGKAYLPYAEAAIRELEEGQHVIDSLKKTWEGSVHLVTPPIDSFPGLLEKLIACCPYLVISNEKERGDVMHHKINDGLINLCISSNIIDAKDLSWEPLTEDRLVVLLDSSNPLAKKQSLTLRDLKNESFSTFPRDTGVYKQIEQFCLKEGYYPKVIFTAERLSDVVNSVLPCRSVSILNAESRDHYSGRISDQLTFVDVADQDCRMVRRLYWRKTEKRKAVLAVRDAICEYFDERRI